jgi:zona occludens toxin (predicted ATPase)
MVSIFTNLKSKNDYKSSTGLTLEKFDLLHESFKMYYIPKEGKNTFTSKKPVLQDSREALFFVLYYLKNYLKFSVLGLNFGFSASTAFEYIVITKRALREALKE